MLLATALALLITGCAQQTFTVQNNLSSSSTKGNHHPSFLFLELSRRKSMRKAKTVAAKENVVKQKLANIRKWIARFYYLVFILIGSVYCSQ